jgi:catechol 2,3-dioxygenase-like lactoylglutathione lyase family enzyme
MPRPHPAVRGFHHVSIKARDLAAARRFYTDVLGFRQKLAWTTGAGRPAAMLDTGDGNYLEIFEDPDFLPAAPGAIQHLALRTTDTVATLARVRAAGMKVTMEPRDATIQPSDGAAPVPIRIAFFEGPGGELIELFQNDRT